MGGNEVHLPPWVARDPFTHSVAVHDHMHVQFGGRLFFDLSQERQEVFLRMPRLALREHFTALDLQGGK